MYEDLTVLFELFLSIASAFYLKSLAFNLNLFAIILSYERMDFLYGSVFNGQSYLWTASKRL